MTRDFPIDLLPLPGRPNGRKAARRTGGVQPVGDFERFLYYPGVPPRRVRAFKNPDRRLETRADPGKVIAFQSNDKAANWFGIDEIKL